MKLIMITLSAIFAVTHIIAMEEKHFSFAEELQLWDAVAKDDGQMVKRALEKGISPLVDNLCGETPLHQCVGYQVKLNALQQLINHLKHKNDIDIYTDPRPIGGGLTPLHIAARHGEYEHVQAIELLLKAGADIDKPSIGEYDYRVGRTPLHCAVQESRHNALDILIKYNARVNVCTKDGKTPLHYAAEQQDLTSIQKLLAAGALTDIHDKWGNTPLHCVVQKATQTQNPKAAIIRAFLAKGVPMDALNNDGESCWMIAKKNDDLVTMYLLEKAGAKTDT